MQFVSVVVFRSLFFFLNICSTFFVSFSTSTSMLVCFFSFISVQSAYDGLHVGFRKRIHLICVSCFTSFFHFFFRLFSFTFRLNYEKKIGILWKRSSLLRSQAVCRTNEHKDDEVGDDDDKIVRFFFYHLSFQIIPLNILEHPQQREERKKNARNLWKGSGRRNEYLRLVRAMKFSIASFHAFDNRFFVQSFRTSGPVPVQEYPFLLHHLPTNYMNQSIDFHFSRLFYFSRMHRNKTNAFCVVIDTKTMQRICLMTMSDCIRAIASIPRFQHVLLRYYVFYLTPFKWCRVPAND